MDVPDVIEYLIDLRRSNKKLLDNYIKLLKSIETIENAMINKTKVATDYMMFIDNMYKESIDNYHKISINLLK